MDNGGKINLLKIIFKKSRIKILVEIWVRKFLKKINRFVKEFY